MTHDPLCPRFIHSKFCEGCTPQCGPCHCSLIAKSRFDERQRIIGVMERNADGDAMKVIDAVLDML